jgi:hypothetical protein
MAEDSRARQAAAQSANEVQRVDLDAIAADAPSEVPAGGAIEYELKGLAMDIGPLGHNVGHKGGHRERP